MTAASLNLPPATLELYILDGTNVAHLYEQVLDLQILKRTWERVEYNGGNDVDAEHSS
jgi:hypothetical protein